MKLWLIKVVSAQVLPPRLVPRCNPTGGVTTEIDPATGQAITIPACDMCTLAEMGHNIIMTLIYAAFVIVVIMAVTGGLRMFFSGGNPEALKTARKHITSAIIGLLIVLVAWLVINLFFTLFVADLGLEGKWWILEELQ
ncbi:MAG: hypothetical protein PHQ43_11490 [Dehalococcoidales bacterium]|nr:hypothetical protein [Dehalococcoidales bacterium]